VTYSLVVNSGTDGIVMPNGIRYAAEGAFTLPDDDFSLLTAGAKARLSPGAGGTSTGYLGGTVSHQVTIASGLKNVVLPNGLRYDAGAVVVLSDAEYSLIPAEAASTLFSSNTTSLT
jgi:hypothetical protein